MVHWRNRKEQSTSAVIEEDAVWVNYFVLTICDTVLFLSRRNIHELYSTTKIYEKLSQILII